MTQNTSLEPSVNGLYVGEIRLLPFRHDELPFGWHFCNGERFLLTSAQGEILSSLSENFRADWGLEEDLCSINLPNLFEQDGGYGLFFRTVDGVQRQVGNFEQDAMRLISGQAGGTYQLNTGITGPFYKSGYGGKFNSGSIEVSACMFDNSRVTPTGPRNIPANLGMTPAIYLGV